MKKLLIFSSILIAFASCKKEYTDQISGTGIIGRWQLIETSSYSIIRQTRWQTVPAYQRAIIEIKPDTSFSFSHNFPKKASLFNRIRTITYYQNSYIELYSTILAPGPGRYSYMNITPVNNNEIILSVHGVDTREEEKYVRVN